MNAHVKVLQIEQLIHCDISISTVGTDYTARGRFVTITQNDLPILVDIERLPHLIKILQERLKQSKVKV